MRLVTKKELERFLAVANNDQELMKKYLQAPTEEERQAIIQAAVPAGESLAELSEEQLEEIAGGSDDNVPCRAVCQMCSWQTSMHRFDIVLGLVQNHYLDTGHYIQIFGGSQGGVTYR